MTYIGLTKHKEETFEGEHDGIIGKHLFDKVQTILAGNRRRTKSRSHAKHRSLLSGLLFTHSGNKLTPTHAQNHDRRYRYYIEKRNAKNSTITTRPVRLPSHEIEASVTDELASYLSDPIKLIDILELGTCDHGAQQAIKDKAKQLARDLENEATRLSGANLVSHLITQITLWEQVDGYTIAIDLKATAKALVLPNYQGRETVTIDIPLKLAVCNNGKKLIIGNKPAVKPNPNITLINALKTAHQIKTQYFSAKPKSLTEIAVSMEMNKRQVWRMLKLAFLAPDIQLAILSGTQPSGICLQDLADTQLPTVWTAQRKQHGFI